MAHAARLNAQVDDLVISVTGLSKQSRSFKNTKDQALRGIKSQNYARTNQFDVQNSLEGLIEKFQVKGQDELAEALESRLVELRGLSMRWRPEILALFLELSDRPLERSTVAALELLQPTKSEPILTWEDIIAEDPLTEEGIWEDINYAVESSEDEAAYEDEGNDSQGASQREPGLAVNEEPELISDSIFVQTSPEILEDIKQAQFWSITKESSISSSRQVTHPRDAVVTELQAVRETLLMVLGLPTSLYIHTNSGEVVKPSPSYFMPGARAATFHHALTELAVVGTKLRRLRHWTQQRQTVPLIQTFQTVVQGHLKTFSKAIVAIEEAFLVPSAPTPVSLIQVTDQIELLAAPALILERIVSNLPQKSPPFSFLEVLFREICAAQLAGSSDTVQLLARTFFESLNTYLRPVRLWMEEGEIFTKDDVFFIRQTEGTSLSDLWHDRYSLRTSTDGRLYAPNFLSFATKKILNAGKSIIFLKEMGHHSQSVQPEPSLTYEAVCDQQSTAMLIPFSELFSNAFELWMQSKFSEASINLRNKLIHDCGLLRTLDAMDLLYFSADGSLFQSFSDALFEKIDSGKGWRDRFILTELAQGTFGYLDCVDADRITVRISSKSNNKTRGVQDISGLVFDYALPWPLLNIMRPSSFAVYQRILELLMKIYRAKYLLRNLWRGSQATAKIHHVVSGLRHRLLWAVDILQAHITFNVLAHETAQMRDHLTKATDIDDMAKIHEQYIGKLRSQCLLSKNLTPIFQAVMSMLDLSHDFATTIRRHYKLEPLGTGPRAISNSNRRRSAGIGLRRARLSSSPVSDTDDDDADGHDDDSAKRESYDADTEIGQSSKLGFEERIHSILGNLERLCSFVVAGLRGVSRAGGEPTWEMLAERLDSKK